jgi:hypothetical protein
MVGVAWCTVASAQAPDRVLTVDGPLTGKVVATAAEAIDLEDRNGETRKIPVEQIREVQFGGEPQSLRAARSLLIRGRAADAVEEVAKIEAAELDGAEPLLLEEVEFVKAAAAGRAALAAGADPKDAGRMVGEFLGKHPKSHHFYDMQQLLGDLLFRAGKPDAALAAYSSLAKGPAALKVRAASAKAGMLFEQQKFPEAMAEYGCRARAGNHQAGRSRGERPARAGLQRAGRRVSGRRRQRPRRSDLVSHRRSRLQRQPRRPRRGARQSGRTVGQGEADRTGPRSPQAPPRVVPHEPLGQEISRGLRPLFPASVL